MKPSGLWVIGAGGHAKVAMSAALASSLTVTGVFADDAEPGHALLGLPVRTPIPLDQSSAPAHLAIGSNLARSRLSKQRGEWRWATIRHPTAWVDPRTRLGSGSMVCAGACVQTDAVVGRHTILNTKSSVDHDCSVGDFVHIGPGAVLCGGVTVEDGVLIGVGASVAPGIRIGAWAVVGAGAVVVRDVLPGEVVVGNPARVLVRRDVVPETSDL